MFLVENDVCVGTKGCKKAGVVGLAVAGVLVLLEATHATTTTASTIPPAIAISGCNSMKPTRLSFFGDLAPTPFFLVADDMLFVDIVGNSFFIYVPYVTALPQVAMVKLGKLVLSPGMSSSIVAAKADDTMTSIRKSGLLV